MTAIALAMVTALALGFASAWLLRSQIARRQVDQAQAVCDERVACAQRESAAVLGERQKALEQRLEDRDRALSEQKRVLDEAERRLSDVFSATASKALVDATDQFLALATQKLGQAGERSHGVLTALIDPLRESLVRLDQASRDIESKREGAYQSLRMQIDSLARETDLLSRALRRPQIRGSWGEFSLQNIAEGAGLVQGKDFVVQAPIQAEESNQRPDLTVRLPRGRTVAVDAKVPLDALREALEAQDEAVRAAKIQQHVKAVRDHVRLLSGKKYWAAVEDSPEMVILYMPDAAYCAAVEADASLIEYAMRSNVVIANPLSVIAVMRAVAHVLNQERLAANAEEVKSIGKDLYTRLMTFLDHHAKVGRSLSSAVNAYNASAGSLEVGVLRRARQLQALGAGTTDDLKAPNAVESQVRSFESP